MGSLSAEESRRLKDEELAGAGEALAKRYLGGLPLRDIDLDMAKRGEDDRKAIVGHLLSELANAIDVDDAPRLEKILAAIEHLSGDPGAAQSIRDLSREYKLEVDKAKEQSLGTLKEAKMQELALRGISGSAVEPAIETSQEWLQTRQGLETRYRERVAEFKARWRKAPG